MKRTTKALKELAPGQEAVLGAIIKLAREGRGRLPTNRQIMADLGFRSTNAVAAHMSALVRKGYVAPAGGRSGILPTHDTQGRPVHMEMVTAEELEYLRAIRRGEGEV